MTQAEQEWQIPLAEIARNGDWKDVTMPYICEEDMVTEDEMEMFDRIIHFRIDSDRKGELGIDRVKEGKASVEVYELLLHTPTIDDLRAVIRRLRLIFIAHDLSEYSWIGIPAAVFKKDPQGRWKQLLAVTAELVGKYFG